MENMHVFGPKIMKLTMEHCTGYANRVLEVLRLAKNVQEMTIYFLDIYKPKSKKVEQLDLPNLKTLKLVTIDHFVAIENAFNQVNSLEHFKLHKSRFSKWESYRPLLFRQSNLRSLELIEVKIDGFAWKELNLLEKLTLQSVTFPQKEAFESFTEFMKTLEKVSELEFDIGDDQRENKNNYSEILKHLLNLKSLSKLTLFCENIGSLISGLKIHNPAVKSLATNQPAVLRFFPNLQQLRIKNTTVEMNENFTGMFSLTEIQVDAIFFQTLLLFKFPCLKKFSALTISNYQEDSTVLETFAQNNPEIEELELFGNSARGWMNRPNLGNQHVAQLIKNLPKLRRFQMPNVNFVDSLEVARFIGENLGNLEYLGLSLMETKDGEVTNYFKEKLPHYRVAVKYDSGRLITIEKI
jgi:hypothetical protein